MTFTGLDEFELKKLLKYKQINFEVRILCDDCKHDLTNFDQAFLGNIGLIKITS